MQTEVGKKRAEETVEETVKDIAEDAAEAMVKKAIISTVNGFGKVAKVVRSSTGR